MDAGRCFYLWLVAKFLKGLTLITTMAALSSCSGKA